MVDGLEFVPAEKGDRVVLSIYGRNFPAQIGMMVDGVPLTQSIGIAQPLIRDDSNAFREASAELKEGKVGGRIERIDSRQIVAVFERPNGKDGAQPVITLTAPGKAKTLNRLSLYINGTRSTTLSSATTPLMFGKRPGDKDKFRIDKIEVFRSRATGYLRAVVRGEGFEDSLGNSAISRVLVNGNSPANHWVDSPTHMRAEFLVPSDETIRLTLVSRNVNPSKTETAVSDPVLNPARLRLTSVSVVSYEAATEDEPAALSRADRRERVHRRVKSSLGELAVKSASEAILKIKDPEAAAVILLTDRETGQQIKTILTRSTAPK